MPGSKVIPSWIHFILLTLLLVWGVRIKDWFLDANRDYKSQVPNSAKTLLLGDSHTVKLMDPSAWENAVNLGMSGEFIYYSYYKLNRLLKDGCRPHSVIISLSYHSLATFPYFGGAEMNKRYHLLVDRRFYHRKFRYEDLHQSTLARYLGNAIGFPILLGQDIAEYYKLRNDSGTAGWMGAYEPATGSRIGKRRSLKAVLRRHFSKFGLPTGLSQAKLEYLNDLARLCQIHGIELWLVNTPVPPDYYKGIPASFIKATDHAASSLGQYDAHYLNLSTEPYKDEEFYDYDHLNAEGSERFSKKLAQLTGGQQPGELGNTKTNNTLK